MAEGLGRKRKLLFISIVGLLVVGSIEVMLQGYYFYNAGDLLFKRVVLAIFELDDVRCYKLQSNLEYRHWTNEFRYTVFTNDQGFRTGPKRPHYSYEKDPDTYRVILIGPSFAYGWGSTLEESYGTLIAEQLRVPGKRVELINIGTPAQGTVFQFCWLEKEGYKYAPDLILSTLYGISVPPAVDSCPEELLCPVIRDGAIYSTAPTLKLQIRAFFKNFALVFYGFYAYNALISSDDEPSVEPGKELYSQRETAAVDNLELVGMYRNFLDFVSSRMGKTTDVVFIYIPMGFIVHPEDMSRWIDFKNEDPYRIRTETTMQVETLRHNGIEIVDTTPELVERGAKERMYYWFDIHFTKAGNRAAADATLPTIQKLINRRFGLLDEMARRTTN